MPCIRLVVYVFTSVKGIELGFWEFRIGMGDFECSRNRIGASEGFMAANKGLERETSMFVKGFW